MGLICERHPPCVAPILQGADSPDRFTRWDRVLGELPMVIAPDSREAARSAAHLYARYRWAGVTPRSANDCLIATHAIIGGMPLLHHDRDFGLVAGVEPNLILVRMEKWVTPDTRRQRIANVEFASPYAASLNLDLRVGKPATGSRS
jgi:predicted nucleic acid-binding protein